MACLACQRDLPEGSELRDYFLTVEQPAGLVETFVTAIGAFFE